MSETNKDIAVAFYKTLFEGRVEDAFRLYAGSPYRQHNSLIEDGMEGLRKFVTWMTSNHPDARHEIKRVFADGDYVILHCHWHGLSGDYLVGKPNPRGEAVVDIFRYPQRGWAQPDAIAGGIPPDASADLVFHGGKTVPQMEFQNIFLGGQASWLASDIDSIDTAITLAMQDRGS
jgi:predicted SnoaL-like aldol condensation-catalyzing enzyme